MIQALRFEVARLRATRLTDVPAITTADRERIKFLLPRASDAQVDEFAAAAWAEAVKTSRATKAPVRRLMSTAIVREFLRDDRKFSKISDRPTNRTRSVIIVKPAAGGEALRYGANLPTTWQRAYWASGQVDGLYVAKRGNQQIEIRSFGRKVWSRRPGKDWVFQGECED
jgi:hypothetical protein